jgi:hypothetical protein
MPSRRTLLTGAAAASASVVAGCARLSGGSDLRNVRHGDTPTPPDGASVVARDERRAGESPQGLFVQQAVAFEHRDRIEVHTDHQLIPGENQFGTRWRLGGFALDHDYRDLDPDRISDRRADYVPADDSEDMLIRMGRSEVETDLLRWRVEYGRNGSTWGPTFVSVVQPTEPLSDGNGVAESRLQVQVARFPFGRETYELETGLIYGRGLE